MMLEKLCLLLLFFQVQFIFQDSSITAITIYTIEGSTLMLTFTKMSDNIHCEFAASFKSANIGFKLRPSSMAIQVINVTKSDTGRYKLCDQYLDIYAFASKVTKKLTCFIESSYVLRYETDLHLCHNGDNVDFLRRKNFQKIRNFTMHLEVTSRCTNFRWCGLSYVYTTVLLKVAKLWFINQTDLKTIVGQEGEILDIICSSDTKQYIAELTLKSNGTVQAIGDNQTVSYSFIPYRTDHLTKYQCLDSKHPSIMVGVELSIRYAPAVTIRYTNGTIKCDCNGVPPICSVHRLDRVSKYEEIVRSVHLDKGTFIFKIDQFPYQRNGRYLCVVSNGIQGTNGMVLQNSSIHVNYEGPPVFAKENRYVKIGKVKQSLVTMSFLVYSCPDVEEVFLEKLGRMRGQKRKIDEFVLKSTLLYNEFDNKDGIKGYDILIESDELYMDDLQPYCITVVNRLGAAEFQFALSKKKESEINQNDRKYVFIICIVGAVVFVSAIVYVGFCIKRVRHSVPIHSNVNEDRTYHTYDEIGTISYSNIRSSHTADNQGENMTQQHAATVSNEINMQSTDNDSTELNADFLNDNLPQSEIPGIQGQHMSISTEITNHINGGQSSEQNNQTSDYPYSESSHNVMVGNAGDGYENPYQTVLQDRQESHQYTQITTERNASFSSAESHCEMPVFEKSLTKEADYINLQF